jgi:hypothetical protein
MGGDYEDTQKQLALEKDIETELGISAEESPQQDEDGVDTVGNNVDYNQFKAFVDAYGVGVRAGTITPQEDDEKFVRQFLGLPDENSFVTQTWVDDGGARRPITLQSQDTFEAQGEQTQESEGEETEIEDDEED